MIALCPLALSILVRADPIKPVPPVISIVDMTCSYFSNKALKEEGVMIKIGQHL